MLSFKKYESLCSESPANENIYEKLMQERASIYIVVNEMWK